MVVSVHVFVNEMQNVTAKAMAQTEAGLEMMIKPQCFVVLRVANNTTSAAIFVSLFLVRLPLRSRKIAEFAVVSSPFSIGASNAVHNRVANRWMFFPSSTDFIWSLVFGPNHV